MKTPTIIAVVFSLSVIGYLAVQYDRGVRMANERDLIEMAMSRGDDRPVSEWIAGGGDMNEHWYNRNTPQDIIKRIFIHDNDWNSPLSIVMISRQYALVEPMLNHGANAKECDRHGCPINDFDYEGPFAHDALKALLGHGADPNQATKYELPLLSFIAWADNSGVNILLDHGANPNRSTLGGAFRPLDILIVSTNFSTAAKSTMLRALLAHGLDLNRKSDYGKTYISVAKQCHDPVMVKLLISLGAKPDTSAGSRPAHP